MSRTWWKADNKSSTESNCERLKVIGLIWPGRSALAISVTPKDLPDPGAPKTAIESGRVTCFLAGILGDQVADAAVALDLLAVDRQQVAELSPGHSLQGDFRSFEDDLHGDLLQSALESVLQDGPEAFRQRFLGRCVPSAG